MPEIKSKKIFFRKIIVFAFFVYSFNVFSQLDTIYADENDKIVSKQIFFQKFNSKIYHALSFKTDTVVLQKLRFSHYFGKLNSTTKNQFFKLLSKKHEIDTTKTLIIHYLDTLKSIDEFPKKTEVVYRDSLNNIVKLPSGGNTLYFDKIRKIKKHKHFFNHTSFINNYKRCIRKHKKYDDVALILHFYGHNNGHPNEYKKVKWYNDYGSLIKKMFTDKYKNFDLIIIHPDGEFYIQARRNDIPYKDLVNKTNWDKYKKDYISTCESLNYY